MIEVTIKVGELAPPIKILGHEFGLLSTIHDSNDTIRKQEYSCTKCGKVVECSYRGYRGADNKPFVNESCAETQFKQLLK